MIGLLLILFWKKLNSQGSGCWVGSFILGPVFKNKSMVLFVSVSVRFELSHCVCIDVRASFHEAPAPAPKAPTDKISLTGPPRSTNVIF